MDVWTYTNTHSCVYALINRSYHDKPRTPGYSIPKMPDHAQEWISVSKNLVQAHLMRCLDANETPTFANGNVYNMTMKTPANGIIVSPYLGKYNRNITVRLTDADVDKTVQELIDGLREVDSKVGSGEFTEVDELLKVYCDRPDQNIFPFDESDLGLNTKTLQSIVD